jgi:hypothetical protein
MGLAADTREITYRELQQRRETLREKFEQASSKE